MRPSATGCRSTYGSTQREPVRWRRIVTTSFLERGECNNVAYLPHAVVGTVLINVTSPKHEPQRQQTRRPCDHQPQQKPLIRFHRSVPPLANIPNVQLGPV